MSQMYFYQQNKLQKAQKKSLTFRVKFPTLERRIFTGLRFDLLARRARRGPLGTFRELFRAFLFALLLFAMLSDQNGFSANVKFRCCNAKAKLSKSLLKLYSIRFITLNLLRHCCFLRRLFFVTLLMEEWLWIAQGCPQPSILLRTTTRVLQPSLALPCAAAQLLLRLLLPFSGEHVSRALEN